MHTFKAGDYVRSTEFYASQFPQHIKANRGRPFRGKIRRVMSDGRVTVKWLQSAFPVTLSPRFVELDPVEDWPKSDQK